MSYQTIDVFLVVNSSENVGKYVKGGSILSPAPTIKPVGEVFVSAYKVTGSSSEAEIPETKTKVCFELVVILPALSTPVQ